MPDTHSLRRDSLLLFVVLCFYFMLLMGLRPLSVPDEGRYPEVAREMLLTHDYVTPRVNGIVFLDKPALYYWLQALSFKLFGVNTWSVRLMPALFAIGGALLVFYTSRQLFNRRAAWWSVAALVCNPLYYLAAQYANMDMEIAIWVTAALCLFLLGRQQSPASSPRRHLFWLAWAAIACGVLTKGLIGLVFPAMVAGVWVLLGWRWCELKHWYFVSGSLLALLICLPWFYAVQKANPQFLHYFFIYQQFERFTSSGFNNEFPVWFYAAVLVVGLLPWSLYFPKALYNQCRCAFGPRAFADAGTRQLLLLWPLLIFIFFSIPASKIVGYILPVLPPLAILVGEYIDRKLTFIKSERLLPTLPLLASVMGAVLSVTLLLLVPRYEKEGVKPLTDLVQAQWQAGDEIVSYKAYFQDLPLYIQADSPLKIVEDWDNKFILDDDNWRREFYLGLQHQPEARQWLIDEQNFAELLKRQHRIFVFANNHDRDAILQKYPLRVLATTKVNSLLVKDKTGDVQ